MNYDQMAQDTMLQLARELVSQLMDAGKKIAVAESCTGGMISQFITTVPGSSQVFDCGICSYGNNIKQAVLGVPQQLLEEKGAVSQEVAQAMVEGVKKLAGADYAIATTGVAGPGGGTQEKPVGLVYVAVASPYETLVFRKQFCLSPPDTRELIPQRAATFGMQQALDRLAVDLAQTN